jgi:hypothetical protein
MNRRKQHTQTHDAGALHLVSLIQTCAIRKEQSALRDLHEANGSDATPGLLAVSISQSAEKMENLTTSELANAFPLLGARLSMF